MTKYIEDHHWDDGPTYSVFIADHGTVVQSKRIFSVQLKKGFNWPSFDSHCRTGTAYKKINWMF